MQNKTAASICDTQTVTVQSSTKAKQSATQVNKEDNSLKMYNKKKLASQYVHKLKEYGLFYYSEQPHIPLITRLAPVCCGRLYD